MCGCSTRQPVEAWQKNVDSIFEVVTNGDTFFLNSIVELTVTKKRCSEKELKKKNVSPLVTTSNIESTFFCQASTG
jgi:hypothetical protein